MRISPFFPKKIKWEEINPETKVYTLVLLEAFDDSSLNTLCDVCFTELSEAYSHFWMLDKGMKTEIIDMTLHEYLKRFCKEVPSMNPFYAIGKLEFAQMYAEKFGAKI